MQVKKGMLPDRRIVNQLAANKRNNFNGRKVLDVDRLGAFHIHHDRKFADFLGQNLDRRLDFVSRINFRSE